MEILSVYDLPIFGSDSHWQFDGNHSTTMVGVGDLSDIVFDSDLDFNGPELFIPFTDSMDGPLSMSPSQNTQSDPSTFTTQPFEFEFDDNLMGCDLFDYLSPSPSSSSEFKPFPSATPQTSSCSSLNSKKREAQVFSSTKVESCRVPKRPRTSENMKKRSPIDFEQIDEYKPDPETIAQVKEMIYRAAVMRPVNLGPELAPEKPKRKNAKISRNPQTAAARERRERLSERLRVLQRLVPGGSKMDTATMLAEASNYLKYLRSQMSNMERSPLSF